METNYFSTMDEFRRVLLPTELCEKLGWKRDSKVNAQINQPDKSLNINMSDNGEMTIDDLGRIALGESILSELGWDIGKISISIDTTGSFLILKQTTNM